MMHVINAYPPIASNKGGMINKKKQGSGSTEVKAQMIDENRERRRDKKRRQKEKKDG